mmetsp:Transcript_22528/g.22722  ORF Transcript_22528/g.22722 Transcript_22528/m.22722 type:complete len:682 (+) Transcript_22528:137-2182(+)|eukprot:CAMPEP_0182437270 /NCGR_PEP_ID=MMETSP1167-20130531/84929_1 /TAXON_ID=2988 /ORGANISM="Mallomonas Sp, Strain CCMP3275" /LENGTH=681 /DNA_ID=CAMNT_0024630121 /DNA_START=106 /DNA_END=2151 /DNA_ORIENTATION=+
MDDVLETFLIPDVSVLVHQDAQGFLGKGTFGDVRRGMLHLQGGTDVYVALKSLPFFWTGDKKPMNQRPLVGADHERVLNAFIQDCAILCRLKHPNIVPFNGLVIDNARMPMYIAQQLVLSGSLRDILYGPQYVMFRERNESTQSEILGFRIILLILKDIFSGLSYLHSMSPVVTHQYLKPTNILIEVQDNRVVKAMLSDIGQTTPLLTQIYQINSTNNYAAPELRSSSTTTATPATKTPAVDIFSAGVIAVEMCSGRRPKPMHSVSPSGMGGGPGPGAMGHGGGGPGPGPMGHAGGGHGPHGGLPIHAGPAAHTGGPMGVPMPRGGSAVQPVSQPVVSELARREGDLMAIPNALMLLKKHICEPCMAQDPSVRPTAQSLLPLLAIFGDAIGKQFELRHELLASFAQERDHLQRTLKQQADRLAFLEREVVELRRGASGGGNAASARKREGKEDLADLTKRSRGDKKPAVSDTSPPGVILSVGRALEATPRDAGLAISSTTAALTCIGHNIRNIAILGEQGLCPKVVKLFNTFMDAEDVIIKCCDLICRLAEDRTNNLAFGDSGCCEICVDCIKLHDENVQVLAHCCKLMYNLAYHNAPNRARLRKAGGCELIVKILQQNMSNAEIALYAPWAIHNMLVNDMGCKTAFVAARGIDAVEQVIEMYADNSPVLRQAELALSKLR